MKIHKNKLIIIALIVVFITNTITIHGQGTLSTYSFQAKEDTLSPKLRLTKPEFIDHYLSKYTLLAHKAVNK